MAERNEICKTLIKLMMNMKAAIQCLRRIKKYFSDTI